MNDGSEATTTEPTLCGPAPEQCYRNHEGELKRCTNHHEEMMEREPNHQHEKNDSGKTTTHAHRGGYLHAHYHEAGKTPIWFCGCPIPVDASRPMSNICEAAWNPLNTENCGPAGNKCSRNSNGETMYCPSHYDQIMEMDMYDCPACGENELTEIIHAPNNAGDVLRCSTCDHHFFVHKSIIIDDLPAERENPYAS